MNMLLIGIFLMIIFFSLWNGYIIRWKLRNEKKSSKIWHKLGWFVRFIPFLAIGIEYWGSWERVIVYELALLLFGWILYDPPINLINEWKILHIDRKGINETMIKIVVFILSFGKKINSERRIKLEKIGIFSIIFIKLIFVIVTAILTIWWWKYL